MLYEKEIMDNYVNGELCVSVSFVQEWQIKKSLKFFFLNVTSPSSQVTAMIINNASVRTELTLSISITFSRSVYKTFSVRLINIPVCEFTLDIKLIYQAWFLVQFILLFPEIGGWGKLLFIFLKTNIFSRNFFFRYSFLIFLNLPICLFLDSYI